MGNNSVIDQKLESIFDLQRQLNKWEKEFVDSIPDRTKSDLMQSLAWEVVEEALELRGNLSIKKFWMNNPTPMSEVGARVEIADLLSAVINLAIISGMNPETLYTEFRNKWSVNNSRRSRQI